MAEILNSMVLLLNSLNIKTEWRILKSSKSFFSITKDFHNAFQGDSISLTPQLRNKKIRNRLGSNGKEHVRKNFLINRHILDYLNIFNYHLSGKF